MSVKHDRQLRPIVFLPSSHKLTVVVTEPQSCLHYATQRLAAPQVGSLAYLCRQYIGLLVH